VAVNTVLPFVESPLALADDAAADDAGPPLAAPPPHADNTTAPITSSENKTSDRNFIFSPPKCVIFAPSKY
jgi:hypothetical protein